MYVVFGLILLQQIYITQKINCVYSRFTLHAITYKETDSERNILLSTLTKSEQWEHEKEWRIVEQDEGNKGAVGIIKENLRKERYNGTTKIGRINGYFIE